MCNAYAGNVVSESLGKLNLEEVQVAKTSAGLRETAQPGRWVASGSPPAQVIQTSNFVSFVLCKVLKEQYDPLNHMTQPIRAATKI